MQKTYAFGEFVLHPAQRLLTRKSGERYGERAIARRETVEIHAKAFDALICFVQRPGEVVSRAELAQALWPKMVVEDNNLSQTIRAVRRALGDAGPPHRFIETVPRRGYQFVAPVTELPVGMPTEVSRFAVSAGRRENVQAAAAFDGCPAPSPSLPESLEFVRPRFSRLAIYFACVAAMALLVPTMTRLQQTSGPDAPALRSGRPVADTVVEGYLPSWPLPEVVACLPEAARRMDPERCESAFRSAQKAERRRKQGLHEG